MDQESWQEHSLEQRIRAILMDVAQNHSTPFGVPYLTAAQISVELIRRNPNLIIELVLPNNNKAARASQLLAKYISQELSSRILTSKVEDIECTTIVELEILDLGSFEGGLDEFQINKVEYNAMMFRMRNKKKVDEDFCWLS